MKQTFKVKLLTGLFGTSLALGAVAIVGYQPQNAYADAAVNGFQMVEGASVRLTDENRGIRFAAQFGEDFYNEAAEYHMMIIPAPLVDKYSLTQNSDFYKVLVEDNKLNVAVTDCLPEEKDGAYRIYGSLTDILYQNSNRTFFGVAYRELAGERVYASYIDGQNERTICEVASKALNDLSAGHSEDDKNYLLGMINDAYKNELGLGKDDTPETALKDALSVKANADNFIATKGDKISLGDTIVSANSEVTDKLNLSLGVYSADETIVNAGKGLALTAAADKSGMTSVGSVLLGEKVTASERKVMVRSEMAGNMLEDYADECSAKPFNSDKQMWINGGGVSGATSWLETYEGRNGVIKLKSALSTNANDVRFFYNRSYEEMINLDFDYISIWAYFDKEGTFDIKNGSVVLGPNVEGKTWTELRLNKDDILKTHGSYEKFCARHDPAVNRSDIAVNNGTRLFSTETEGEIVYIDSVSFVKFFVSQYSQPNGGEEFELPTVKLLDFNGNELSSDCQVTVTLSHSANSNLRQISSNVAVVDGKIKIHSGTYTISYAFEYNGENFVKEINITGKTAALASNELEDFDDPARIKNLEPWNRGTDSVEWLEYYEGKYGIAHATNGKDSGVSLRFDKTVEELKNLDFDYINITIWVNSPSTSLAIKSGSYQLGTIKGKEWQTITITKDVIVNEETCWYNSDATNKEQGGGMDAFAYRHSTANGQNGYYLFSFPWAGIEYYIDSISFGKNNA